MAASARRALAVALGAQYTWTKLASLGGFALVLFLVFAKGWYKVKAPFAFEAISQYKIAAPFDGFIKSVDVEVGDAIIQGRTALAELDTAELRLQLASAKAETIKLLDMLIQDFGFSKDEIRVSFSGHRGYHVHVETEAIETLDTMDRKEIVDYVCGLGFDKELHGLKEDKSTSLHLKAPGWQGRIARGIYDTILNTELDDYHRIGLNKHIAQTIMKSKESILKNIKESKPWSASKGLGPQTLAKLVEHSVHSQLAKVDTVVTTDIHRLIRLSGTLHGKTGLKKVEFPISSIESFDPFKSATAFEGGSVCVLVSDAPQFCIDDQEFGPFRNEKTELPIAAALLLLCKKRAEVM
jgi:DNA primase small subunit